MDDALLVRGFERLGDLLRDRQAPRRPESARARCARRGRLAFDPVLHDDDARRRGGPVGAALLDHQEPLAVG